MKGIYKSILYIGAVIGIAGCAKAVEESVNEASKRYFDAWVSINHPDLKPSWKGVERADSNGIYIIHEVDGEADAKTVTNNGYAIVEYRTTDLAGNITSYTDSTTARQLGTYSPANYYGSKVWLTMDGTIQAGLQDALVGMKVGGSKKVIIPSWLMTYNTYDTVEEYLGNASDYSNTIYEFTVKDFTDSIDVWQADSIERYIIKEYSSLATFSNDTTGFYFKRNGSLPESAKEFPSDTTIYINYTGKLLNGLVFDTTDEKIAKDNNIYSASKKYTPVQINWANSYSEITMGSSSSTVIQGFAMTLWRMRCAPDGGYWKDKCTGIFYSNLGYGYSGSGSSIPGYAPLIFEIEIVDEPED